MSEQEKNGRIEWIDVLKCVAMYLVVIGHASNSASVDSYRYYIYSFHMPLFLIVSGMTFYFQMKKRNFDFIPLLKNKLKGLVLPYFTLNLIAIPIWMFNYRVISYRDESLGELIFAMLWSNERLKSSATNATWFILTLFLALIVFYLILRWADGDEHIIVIASALMGLFGYSISFHQSKLPLPWHLDTVPIAVMMLMMGYVFVAHVDKVENFFSGTARRVVCIIILLFIGFCCARFNTKISLASNFYGSFLLFLGSVAAFSLVCVIISMMLPKLKIMKFIGRNTIVYLAFHAPCFRFMANYSDATAAFKANHPIILGTIVFFAMIPVCWVIERWLPFLIGRKYGQSKGKKEETCLEKK